MFEDMKWGRIITGLGVNALQAMAFTYFFGDLGALIAVAISAMLCGWCVGGTSIEELAALP